MSGWLPQPIADLVVKGLRIFRLYNPSVIAQAVEKLRPIGLSVDRLEFVALDESLMLGTVGLWIDVLAASAGPDAGHAGEWPEVCQRVSIRFGFRVDVRGVVIHEASR